MNKIKNAIANTPIYIGFGLQKASQFFYTVSIKLHITLKTEIGLKVIAAKDAMEKMAQAMKAAQAAQEQESSKLYNIMKPEVAQVVSEDTPTGVIRLVKKNSDSKN